MAVLGIIFVIQPEALFDRQFSSGQNEKEILLNKTVKDGTSIQRSQFSMEHITFTTALFGFTFAVLSGICRAADSLILKYLSNNMSIIELFWSILFWSFVNQFLLSVTIMYSLETFTYPQTISQVVWSFTHGVSHFLVWPFYIIAIPKLRGSTFIVLLSSFSILFMVLGQYTFLRNIQPGYRNWIEGVGIVPVLCGSARFIRTVCMRRIRWSCEGLTSVHNEYTGYPLKHLLLRHMYNLPLPVLMGYALKPYALRLLTTTAATASAFALYCAVLYMLLV